MRALEPEDTPLVALRSRRVEVLSRLLVPGTVMYQENRSRNLYIAMWAGLHRPRSLPRQFCLLLLPALMSCRQNSGSRTRRMLSECGGTWDMNGDVSFRIHSSWFSDVSKTMQHVPETRSCCKAASYFSAFSLVSRHKWPFAYRAMLLRPRKSQRSYHQ